MKSQALLTVWCNISGGAGGEIWHWSLSGVKGLTSLSTDSDCCAFAPEVSGQPPKNAIYRNYKITKKRLLSCAKELVQNVTSWSQVSQSIMVASLRGIVV